MTREEVVRFYVAYDRKKHSLSPLIDIATWTWDNPEDIDRKLQQNGFKTGVLAAYRLWWFLELSLADLFDCAIVNHIFKNKPQQLSRLFLEGVVESWQPNGNREWYSPLERGDSFPRLGP